jgi:D-3-phosphoglycerate dehydrogenase
MNRATNQPQIVILDPISHEAADRLRKSFEVVDLSSRQRADQLPALATADCIIVRSRTKVNRELFEMAPELKVVARAGVGLDNVDTKEADSRSIRILSTPHAPTTSVAELVLGFMIALARGIGKGDRGIRNGRWLKSELEGTELSGKVLGVIGYGRIGSAVGKLGGCLGMSALGWDILGPQVVTAPAMYTEVDDMLEQADFITLHVPLTDETRSMVNARFLAKMKKTAYIINASRGEVVDEDALYDALKNGTIAGAALDVFGSEPYTGRLRELENVILTPHIGASTEEAQRRSASDLAEQIEHWFEGSR